MDDLIEELMNMYMKSVTDSIRTCSGVMASALAALPLAGVLSVSASPPALEVETLMCQPGRPLFTGLPALERRGGWQPISDGFNARITAGQWKRVGEGAFETADLPEDRHIPHLAIAGKVRNVVMAVEFQFLGAPDETDEAHCFRLSFDNREAYRGHTLSCWAVWRAEERSHRLELEHVAFRPDKTLLRRMHFWRESIALVPGEWYSMVVEIFEDEAVCTVGPFRSYAKFPELAVEKSILGITLGKSPHRLRNVRLWEAAQKQNWAAERSKAGWVRTPAAASGDDRTSSTSR
jgi:hypothetical protein